MELNYPTILLVIIIVLFLLYYYKSYKVNKNQSSLFKRMVRNKNIANQYVEKLKLLIHSHNLMDSKLIDNDEQNYKNYIDEVEQFCNAEFSNNIMNKLKNNSLSYDEKSVFRKKILAQSDLLYQLQTRIQQVINKYGDVN